MSPEIARRVIVAFHIKHIHDKMQVHSKSAAVAKALRDGLLD